MPRAKKGVATQKSALPAAIADLVGGLEVSATTAATGGDQFLKFTKFGEFVFGADNFEVEEDSEWAANPLAFGQGWIAWGDEAHGNESEMLGEVMVPAAQPMPAQPEAVEGKWVEQRSMQLVCLTGDDADTQCLFKTSSIGGKKLYAALVMEVVKRIKAGDSDVVPIIHLLPDSYQHAKYGKIFTPTYEVVRWEEMDATAPSTDSPDEEPEQAEEPAVEKEPEAPRRKRKRAA